MDNILFLNNYAESHKTYIYSIIDDIYFIEKRKASLCELKEQKESLIEKIKKVKSDLTKLNDQIDEEDRYVRDFEKAINDVVIKIKETQK